jgi:TonB family protein
VRITGRWTAALAAALALAGCRADQAEVGQQAASRENEVPVALNGEPPFQYPTDLYDQGIEGEVRLRLYVDSAGRVAPESTRIVSSSGTPALDSAAVAGAPTLRFAPAHRDGVPVGTAFYQPVIFRRRAGAAPPVQ